MSEKKNDPFTVVAPEARLSWPNLIKPKSNFEGQPEKFSATFLFEKDSDLSKLKTAAKLAVQEKWGAKPPKGLKNPFKDGNKRTFEDDDGVTHILDGYKDAIFIVATANADSPPGLVDEEMNRVINQSTLYAGCYVYAALRAFAYEKKNKSGGVVSCGVSFGIQAVQKVRDGEPFGAGRSKPEDYFSAVAGGSDNPDNYGDDVFGDDMFGADESSSDDNNDLFS